jgi:hypothetical protein
LKPVSLSARGSDFETKVFGSAKVATSSFAAGFSWPKEVINVRRDTHLLAPALALLALVCAASGAAAQQQGQKITPSAPALKPSAGVGVKLPVPDGKSGALKPELALMGAVTETIGGKQFSVTKLTIVNWEKFSPRFFKAAPELPPCGKNKNSARSWLTIHRQDNGEQIYGYCAMKSPADLKDFSYATPEGETPPLEVFVLLTDRATKTVYQSNCINAWSGVACGKP